MPWNTTEISESIHVSDSAKYSRNKLNVFGNLKQETRSGKNKFNAKEKLNASTTKNNITYTKNADNTFDISGTASANTLINVATVTDIIQRAKSYYLYSSKEYNLATFNLSVVVKYLDGDTQYIGVNKSNVTTLTDKEIKSATLDFYAAEGITVNASNVKIMLVESDTVDNEFEEYEEMPSIDYPSMPVVATGVQTIKLNDNVIATLDLGNTELCKIVDSDGNVVAQDRSVYRLQEDGTYKWQWEKNIVKIILNGTETWRIDKLRPNCNYRSFYNTTKKLKQDSFIISNLLKNNNEIYDTDNLGICVNWQNSIRIKNGVSKTVEELQTWLSANNLTCYCIVKTPEYEDCTAEQSEVLDKLYKLQLEQSTNNIFVESENGVTTELQLTYMQDNNLIKEQQHKAMQDEIDTLKQAVVALGGVV